MRNRKHHDQLAPTERIAVIGLGRFGTSLANTLHDLGYDVTAVDRDERRVQEATGFVTVCAQGDGSDRELLLQLNIDKSDVAIVAQGESLEASVLTTLLLKKLGVPWVVAKAKTSLHGELLEKVGADRVIFPEKDAGMRLAHSIGVRSIVDYISLSATAGIAKMEAPSNLIGHTIAAIAGGQEHRLSVLLIKRGSELLTVPRYDEVIEENDEIVIVGADQDIESFGMRRPGPSAPDRR